jgi:hypothetical protein
MTSIELTTLIEAPIERCFQLSPSIDLELKAVIRAHQCSSVADIPDFCHG